MASADIVNAINAIYDNQLGRAADPAGLAYYANEVASGNKTIEQVNAEINRSSEGAAYDKQTVENLYQQGLGRQADAGGLNYWVGQLQSGNVAPEGVARVFYETAIGKGGESTEAGRQAAARGLLDIATEQQLGKDISAADRNFVASYTDKLLNQGATLDQIAKELNRSTEGVNFDTQAISAIYRQQFGRDAEQEGYQYYMSRLQNEGLTPAQAKAAIMGGAAGRDVAAMASRAEASLTAQNPYRNLIESNVFEADPYGGRFYTRSPYDLGTNAVNVSTLADGTKVQWNAPITQNAKVTGYDAAGNFTVREGQPTINAGEVNAAIKRAVAAGTLTDAQATEIATRIRDSVSGAKDASEAAKTLNNFYGILDDYTTKVAIDPMYGIQTGQGSTADIAMKNYQNLSNLIATNERMPSIPQIASQVITDARGTGPSMEDYKGPVRAGQLPTSYTDFLRINPMTGKVEQATGGTFAGGDITGPRPFYSYNTVDTTGNVVTPQNYQNTVLGLSTLMQRPTYAPVTFTGPGTAGVPAAGTSSIPAALKTYQDLALLQGAAPGAPTVLGIPDYAPYSGVPVNPVTGQPMVETARPAVNVSPVGLGAREITTNIASTNAPGMRGGGLAGLAQRLEDKGRDGDTELVHMTKDEVAGLHSLARSMGGQLTRNPYTGLYEANFLSDIWKKAVIRPTKKIFQALGPIGTIIAAHYGGPIGVGIAEGFKSKDKSFDFQRGLKSAAAAYVGRELLSFVPTTPGAPAPITDASIYGPGTSAAGSMPTITPPVVVPPPGPAAPVGDVGFNIANRPPGYTPGAPETFKPTPVLDTVVGGAKAFGIDTPYKALTAGVMGTSLVQGQIEREKFKDEQERLAAEEEERNRRFRELGLANVQANPYRLIAEGGYIDDNPVSDMAAGGLKEGSFIVPADVVAHLGNGSSEAGLKTLAKKYGARPIKGPGDGMSDSIPTTIEGRQRARVADGEAIISPAVTAKVGPKQLYSMLDKVRKARTGTTKQGKQINPMRYLPA